MAISDNLASIYTKCLLWISVFLLDIIFHVLPRYYQVIAVSISKHDYNFWARGKLKAIRISF